MLNFRKKKIEKQFSHIYVLDSPYDVEIESFLVCVSMSFVIFKLKIEANDANVLNGTLFLSSKYCFNRTF